MVITTGSATSPRNAFGKPNSCACQLSATVPQLITSLMSQERLRCGSAARRTASTDRTNEASRLRHAENSIVP